MPGQISWIWSYKHRTNINSVYDTNPDKNSQYESVLRFRLVERSDLGVFVQM